MMPVRDGYMKCPSRREYEMNRKYCAVWGVLMAVALGAQASQITITNAANNSQQGDLRATASGTTYNAVGSSTVAGFITAGEVNSQLSRAEIKFNYANPLGAGEYVQSAVLRLFLTANSLPASGNGSQVLVYASRTQSGTSAITAADFSDASFSQVGTWTALNSTAATNQWYEFDVTSVVSNDIALDSTLASVFRLQLNNDTNILNASPINAIKFTDNSVAGGTIPQLVITTAVSDSGPGSGLKLHGLFTDGMVMQRNESVAVYGTADTGEVVTVNFLTQSKTVTTDAQGNWKVFLDPLTASSTPADMVVKSNRGGSDIIVHNILVGDVWIMGGQSNMARNFSAFAIAKQDIVGVSNNLIRIYKVDEEKAADQPESAVVSDADFNGGWQIAQEQYLLNFSPASYYMGKRLTQESGVPVGMILAARGATCIESWLPGWLVASDPNYEFLIGSQWPNNNLSSADIAAGRTIALGRASGLYNHVVAPLRGFTFKGFCWYQGESNSQRPYIYRKELRDLITSWRQDFGKATAPFLVVEIAPYGSYANGNLGAPWLREAQSMAQAVTNTGFVTTVDVGEYQDIHPQAKQSVGDRLAYLSLEMDGLAYKGRAPCYNSMQVNSNTIAISFSNVGANLSTHEVRMNNDPGQPIGQATNVFVVPAGTVAGFQICGSEQVFVDATATISSNQVIVSSAGVSAPVAVRYAWLNFPLANLTAEDGRPVPPFRTDNFVTPYDPPVFVTNRLEATAAAGVLFTGTMSATDPNGGPLSYAVVSCSGPDTNWLTVNINTGALSGVPALPGSYHWVISVKDSTDADVANTAYATVDITVKNNLWLNAYDGSHPNTIALWHMDDPGERDDTGVMAGKLNLTNNPGGGLSFTTGRFGTGLQNAAPLTDRVIINGTAATNDAYFPGGADPSITVEAWVKLNAAGGTQVIVYNQSGGGYLLQKTSLGKILWGLKDTSNVTYDVVCSNALTSGLWYHVAGTWDASNDTSRLYINGVLAGSLSIPGLVLKDSVSSVPITLLNNPDGTAGLDGVIDELRISNTAYVFDTAAPVWTTNPLIKPDAMPQSAFSDTLRTSVSYTDMNMLTFSKADYTGPSADWLSVSPNGSLSGTVPVVPGRYSWRVIASDGSHLSENTLTMTVINTVWGSAYDVSHPDTIALWHMNDPAERDDTGVMAGKLSLTNNSGGGLSFTTGRFGAGLQNAAPLTDRVIVNGTMPAGDSYFPSGADPSITVEAWVKINATGGTQIILYNQYGGGYLFQKTSQGKIIWGLKNTANTIFNVQSTNILTVGQWYHIAGTWDAASDMSRLYINGVLDGSTNIPGFVLKDSSESKPITLLSKWDGTSGFDGVIDELRISDIAYVFGVDAYSTWVAAQGLSSYVRTADDDNDGRNNEFEYCFGMDPKDPSNAVRKAPFARTTTSTGLNYPAMTYSYRNDGTVHYYVDTSTNLQGTWVLDQRAAMFTDVRPATNNLDNTSTVTIRYNTDFSGLNNGRLFIRIRAAE